MGSHQSMPTVVTVRHLEDQGVYEREMIKERLKG